jgi:hypothetical protein
LGKPQGSGFNILVDTVSSLSHTRANLPCLTAGVVLAGAHAAPFPSVILIPHGINKCVRSISDGVRSGEAVTRDQLSRNTRAFPENWQKAFVKALKDMTDENNPAVYFPNGTPFGRSLDDDDVPF